MFDVYRDCRVWIFGGGSQNIQREKTAININISSISILGGVELSDLSYKRTIIDIKQTECS